MTPYNWDKGMVMKDDGLHITGVDGEKIVLQNVKFYDTIRGFIQTDDGDVYGPESIVKQLAGKPV